MKNKGFTLVELLAVIVILAVISLIATPMILGVIETAKKEAAEGSAVGYLQSLNNYIVMQELLNSEIKVSNNKIYQVTEDTEYEYTDLDFIQENPTFDQVPSEIKINNIISIKGTLPTDGYVILGNGKIEEAEFVINEYKVYCDSNEKCATLGKAVSSSNVSKIEIEEPITTIVTSGNTIQLNVIVETIDETEAKILWSSTNEEVATVDKNGLVKGIKEGVTTIVATAGRKTARIIITVINDSILGYLADPNLEDNTYMDIIANGEIYPVHLYVYDGDTTFSENKVFGDANDVATGIEESQMAKNMVIVKVNGDLTINEGVTVNPYYTEYGGPKGFLLYVTGKLTNNGVIDNSHGAYAEGQNVYLWKNSDGTYEYVPLKGAQGSMVNAGSGESGSNRETGGGGSGGNNGGVGGNGSFGTSYSGGIGGGGTSYNNSANPGNSNGGPGGNGAGSDTAGGAGNPGGSGNPNGLNGSGGLLIIYSNEYENKGTISAKGTKATYGYYGSGGATGGGSINIFTNQPTGIDQLGIIANTRYNEIKGNTIITGGNKVNGTWSYASGGAGGDGTVNIGEVRNGQYYDLKEIIEQDIEAYNANNQQ